MKNGIWALIIILFCGGCAVSSKGDLLDPAKGIESTSAGEEGSSGNSDLIVESINLGAGTTFQGAEHYYDSVAYTLNAVIKNQGSSSTGGGFTLQATIGNNTNGTACDGYNVNYVQFSNGFWNYIGTANSTTLAAGASATVSIPITVLSTYQKYGPSNYVNVRVDSGGNISERNEDNNCSGFNLTAKSYSVGTGLKQLTLEEYKPDLIITAHSVTAAGIYTRSNVYPISVTVKNNGPKPITSVFTVKSEIGTNILYNNCNASNIGFFTTVAGTYSVIGSGTVLTLAADTSAVVNYNITIPAGQPIGASNYINVAVDSTLAIPELLYDPVTFASSSYGEKNNCGDFNTASNTYATGTILKQVNIN